jgi:hypothetical protein
VTFLSILPVACLTTTEISLEESGKIEADADTDSDVDADADGDVDGDIDADTDADTDADADVDADADADAGFDALVFVPTGNPGEFYRMIYGFDVCGPTGYVLDVGKLVDQVTRDPRTAIWYGNGDQSVGWFDAEGGFNELFVDGDVDPLDWSMSVAFDAEHNHLLLLTLGGAGTFYTWNPTTAEWAGRSLDNLDVAAATWGDDDRVYALEVEGGAVYSRLHVLDHEGTPIGRVDLTGFIPSVRNSGGPEAQIRYLDGGLVVIAYEADAPNRTSLYWIDPESGDVSQADCG